MKRKLQLFTAILWVGILSAQEGTGEKSGNSVGINTEEPQATLHVNGTVRLQEPGDYSNKALLLGRDKETKKLVALDPNESLFTTMRLEQDYVFGERLDLLTGLYKEDVEISVLNARLVYKDTNEVPVMKVYTVSSSDYFWGPVLGQLHTLGDAKNKDTKNKELEFKGAIDNVMTEAFFTAMKGSTYLTTGYSYLNNDKNMILAKAVIGGEDKDARVSAVNQRGTLFYSPPKYLVDVVPKTVKGKVKNEWKVFGGYINQVPIDDDKNRPMKYVLDLLIVNKNIIKNYSTVDINIKGLLLNEIEVPEGSPHPIIK